MPSLRSALLVPWESGSAACFYTPSGARMPAVCTESSRQCCQQSGQAEQEWQCQRPPWLPAFIGVLSSAHRTSYFFTIPTFLASAGVPDANAAAPGGARGGSSGHSHSCW